MKSEKQKNYHSKNSGKSALVWNFFSSQKNEEKEEEEKVHKKLRKRVQHSEVQKINSIVYNWNDVICT